MILDFDSRNAPAEIDADLCIAGAGAAGIALALEFARASQRIVVLESGGEFLEPETQSLCESELRGLPCATVHEGRARRFGGTTTMWAGQALALDELDFEARDWVPSSGWPLTFAELQPYYRRAERLMGLPDASYGERGWPRGLPMPPVTEGLVARFSTFSPIPNFATSHRSELDRAPNVTVLLHANVKTLVMDGEGARVGAIEIASLASGRSGRIRAHRYVICCGGVETARLLLASGVGNDLVGRYFQEHVHVNVPVPVANRRLIGHVFHSRRIAGIRHLAKLSASPALQRQEQMLNVGANVSYDRDANRAVRAVRDGDVLGALRYPGQLGGAVYRRVILRQKASEGFGTIYFCVQIENLPRRDSRVMLAGRTDALGLPRAVVDWRVGEEELRTAQRFAGRLAALLSTSGLGRLDLSGFPLPREVDILRERVAGGCHHIGTARMADHPHDGVVDPDCRVFGVENLFVAGSAVFPTSGWSNPTLTLLALCYRLADRLKEELASRGREAAGVSS
jgi:choline dehydrogenase-like flavoprotein